MICRMGRLLVVLCWILISRRGNAFGSAVFSSFVLSWHGMKSSCSSTCSRVNGIIYMKHLIVIHTEAES